MKAIYKKEIRSYFTSVLGYLFIGFLLFVIGLYFTAYNLNYAYPEIGYTLSSSIFVFLIIVPILTMKIMADERRLKTDQMLLTAPVRNTDIIIGKYLALLTVFLLPVILCCIYPVILSSFGSVNFKMSYTAILGFFLFGALALAIGMFISSLTESQVIAAVLSFALLLIMFMMNGITSFISGTAFASLVGLILILIIIGYILYHMTQNYILAAGVSAIGAIICIILYVIDSSKFAGKLTNILSVLNVTEKFSNFAGGTFDVTGVVYYLSLTSLFLFLTIQAIQKRRWS
ncbi:ABC transporter permease [Anaerosacchariphilus polymeriproducens]|uniref:ABC transporter n=1 Tax=Anaerosacchariphilus polymeriproducens TaxID=1812858 RepID=A0A371AWB7_9FIRM|nr:ABC transporter permease [Anaerosacchariphilus polymeriproducens]RDU23760.1 ABC transporter [Anaerosacchariphilus polymeriproducens]